jgi:hypothetical protein
MAVKIASASIEGLGNSPAWIEPTESHARLAALDAVSREAASSERAAPVSQAQRR